MKLLEILNQWFPKLFPPFCSHYHAVKETCAEGKWRLRCLNCGHVTTGWAVVGSAPNSQKMDKE